MPTLSETHQPPADGRITSLASAVQSKLNRFASALLPCRHKNTSLPINDRQRCLDCGASRLYIFSSDFEHADAGIFIGKWRPDTLEAVKAQDARQILRKAEALHVALLAQPEGMSLFEFSAAVKYPETLLALKPTARPNSIPTVTDHALALVDRYAEVR